MTSVPRLRGGASPTPNRESTNISATSNDSPSFSEPFSPGRYTPPNSSTRDASSPPPPSPPPILRMYSILTSTSRPTHLCRRNSFASTAHGSGRCPRRSLPSAGRANGGEVDASLGARGEVRDDDDVARHSLHDDGVEITPGDGVIRGERTRARCARARSLRRLLRRAERAAPPATSAADQSATRARPFRVSSSATSDVRRVVERERRVQVMVLILALENQRRVPVQRASLREVLRLARERLGLGLGTRRVPVPVRGFSRGALAHVRALHPARCTTSGARRVSLESVRRHTRTHEPLNTASTTARTGAPRFAAKNARASNAAGADRASPPQPPWDFASTRPHREPARRARRGPTPHPPSRRGWV